ncbi:MAG: sel1 repeat family protein [Deltaproteobacteria bacterium]|nr:sel1 repeat family protein [Deltaproteobacteria bacterium]
MPRFVAIVVTLLVVAFARPAGAVERTCAAGQTWDDTAGKCVAKAARHCGAGAIWSPNLGACIKKQAARRLSPEEKYYQAIDQLEGKVRGASAARGAALLTEACTAKLAPACTLVGYLYLNGLGVAKDAPQALAFDRQGCELGDDDGCIGAADVHSRGLLGEVDHASAIPLLATACGRQSGRACVLLGGKYANALGTEEDQAKATASYQRAYELLRADCPKSGPSCYQLGLLFAEGLGRAADPAQAYGAFDEGCKAGSGDACNQVAQALLAGTGAAVDRPAAFEMFNRACVQYDHAAACHDAAVMVVQGQATLPDDALVARAQRACELDARQCDMVGYLAGTGRAGTKDQAVAVAHYAMACNAGNGGSCTVLGNRSETGNAMPKDGDAAVGFWNRGCENDDADGCLDAGKAFADGELVKADAGKAFQYGRLGCLRGSGEACSWAGGLLADGADGSNVKHADQALLYYDRACEIGWNPGCALAGNAYRDGLGTKVDMATARARYVRGCDGVGDSLAPAACEALGRLHYNGDGGPKDLGQALTAFARACRFNIGQDCYFLDAIAREGELGSADQARVDQSLREACDAKVDDACVARGWVLAQGYSGARDPRAAFGLWDAACTRGATTGCLALAGAYRDGTGVVADPEQARRRYTELCNKDTAQACTALAGMLAEQDKHADAFNLYQRACTAGDGNACNSVGFAHYTSHGAPWDVVKAAAGYQKACDLGEPVGCSNVGELYEYGIAYAKDPTKAYAFYQKGCTPSSDIGCGRLARYYATGAGGAPVDTARAIKEYRRACDSAFNTPEPCRELGDLLRTTGQGKPSEIAQLGQRAFDRAKELARTNPFYQYVLGTYYLEGVATVKDPKKAADLFVSACDGYDPVGCLAAGRLLLASGAPADRERAVVQLDRACAAQVTEACDLAGTARAGDKTVPLAPRKGGCACATGSAGDGALPILIVGLAWLRRRRRAGA